ncbi:MAG: hypothetical protein M1835_000721 [Candelina submexicana]|nr:MAG: hypothetical protein M1835_000721 [Candelina submexicana]
MVPNTTTILNELPITMNGKIDRKALANRQEIKLVKERPTRGQSIAEQQVAQVWANMLNIALDRIGVNENFFHLGGKSIDAIEVVAGGQRIGIELTVADIRRYSTLHGLAEKAVDQQNPPQGFEFEPLALIDSDDIEMLYLAVSFSQLQITSMKVRGTR